MGFNPHTVVNNTNLKSQRDTVQILVLTITSHVIQDTFSYLSLGFVIFEMGTIPAS